MRRFLGISLLFAITLVAGGCASQSPADLDRPRESSIPWNKPQSWEGPGAMGAAGANGTR